MIYWALKSWPIMKMCLLLTDKLTIINPCKALTIETMEVSLLSPSFNVKDQF